MLWDAFSLSYSSVSSGVDHRDLFLFRFGFGWGQAVAAIFAKLCIIFVSGSMAVGAFFVSSAFIFFHHGGRYDTCRYGDNRVTDEHDAGGKEFSEAGGGSNISITYGSHGDDSPIDAVRDIVELGVGLRSFNHIH